MHDISMLFVFCFALCIRPVRLNHVPNSVAVCDLLRRLGTGFDWRFCGTAFVWGCVCVYGFGFVFSSVVDKCRFGTCKSELRCVRLRCVRLRCVIVRCVIVRCVSVRCASLRCVSVVRVVWMCVMWVCSVWMLCCLSSSFILDLGACFLPVTLAVWLQVPKLTDMKCMFSDFLFTSIFSFTFIRFHLPSNMSVAFCLSGQHDCHYLFMWVRASGFVFSIVWFV